MSKLTPTQISKALEYLASHWTPHTGQRAVRDAVFKTKADLIYVECGRKWGKSEFGVYSCWIYAIMNPNAEIYYLAPLVKQARELVWSNQRMQSANSYDADFITNMSKILGGEIQINKSEMRVILPNGSFIKCDGSDNVEAQRGFKPDFIAADEYRDFKANWIEAVRPNMAVKEGKMLFITTPPHGPNQAFDMAQECQRDDEHVFYINQPSNVNDRIPGHTEWLAREKGRLDRLGRHNEWLREYMAQYVVSDEHAVIPQLNTEALRPSTEVEGVVTQLRDRMELMVALNPGNSTTMEALLAAFDPYTATLYIVDQIYEWDSQKANMRHFYPMIQKMLKDHNFNENDVHIVVNPETPWICRDLADRFDIGAATALPESNKKDYNISLLKDILDENKLVVSDQCRRLALQSEGFLREIDTLKIKMDTPRSVECLKYLLDGCGYSTEMLELKKKLPEDEDWIKRLTEAKSFDSTIENTYINQHGETSPSYFEEFYEDSDA